ncbi:MAG: tripartite tricarboxylate transporter substrate binding protein [Burkholderiales bacterium]|nr:tripartite tricarboxylate transporter substrate binding protein [Burkholderiales bacterium]
MDRDTGKRLGCAAAAAFVLASHPAAAATADPAARFPHRPVRLIVPFPPGGGTDITARATAARLSERWGVTVVTDNRPGANGTIGVDLAAKSPPDGHTISMISSSHTVNVSLYARLPYDLRKDLAAVTQATSQPYAMVIHPSVTAKTVKEFIAYARAKPGAVSFGSSGIGGISHLGGELLASIAGIRMLHVPYKGGGQAMVDLVGGQIQMQLATLLLSGPHLKAGRLRAMAVTTPGRWPGTPELPTMQEAGVPGFAITQWYGIVAPARTPPAIVAKLSKDMSDVLQQPDVRDRLAADGAEAVGSRPEAFGAHIGAEVEKYGRIVKQLGLKAE